MTTMDPVTFEIQNLYYQNAYKGCISSALKHAPNGVQDETSLVRLVYAARAAISLGDLQGARQYLGDDSEYPMAMSVLLYADFLEAQNRGDNKEALGILEQLESLLDVAEPGELAAEVVRYHIGLALFANDETEKALEVLGVANAGTSRELECVALGVHILLAIHRVDLAEKEYLAARQWGDDLLLVQFMEAWIGLVRGGRATQQAYYVYDELSQSSAVAHSANTVPTMLGKAVAQAALGEPRQALTELREAAELDQENTTLTCDQAAIAALCSDTTQEERTAFADQMKLAAPYSELAQNWAAKELELDEAIASFA
ncbi:hypothetical protein MVES1_000410 [Malassezia vespertilionis]|uniref:Coatomer subunit epsilon n=1 Tax=Malassezia vespertilionis TaxID=2020962 RepID=A0A2N1JGT2_9BASI|nr:uncharacterized protein MVES1_000410 [Malassezia vespertilionis]PKI85745.1 hypothetical protein MVES_000384 [Malassezia vespertilionis]WFD05084.1 hypothetical protein MVES1_000410 [Malassezia vespertilionis]